jgi:hypothetical protein
LDGSNADGRTDLNPITERDVGVASSSDTSPSEFPHDVSSSVADLLKPDDFGYIDAGIAPIKAADGGSDWAYARMDVPNGALVDAPDAPAGTSDSINGSTTVVDVAEPDNLNSQPVDALIAPNTTGDGGSDLADAATDALKGSQTYLFDASAETSHPVDAGIFPVDSMPLASSDAADAGPGAQCTASSIAFNNTGMSACAVSPCQGFTCANNPDGTLLMNYTIDCTSTTQAWGVCGIAVSQNLANFDIAYGGSGVLEVVFCVESTNLQGGVNLWYGKDPLRKKLELVLRDEILPAGCYVRYFSPSQAVFPSWPGIPSSCAGQCGAGKDTCSADFQAAISSYVATKGDTAYDLHTTYVQIAAEDCSKTASGSLSVSWVRYLNDGCLCSDSGECTSSDRPSCRTVSPEICGPWSPSLPPGVCGPSSIGCSGPPGIGVPCTVSIGNKVCGGLTECAEGRYVCPSSGCS